MTHTFTACLVLHVIQQQGRSLHFHLFAYTDICQYTNIVSYHCCISVASVVTHYYL